MNLLIFRNSKYNIFKVAPVPFLFFTLLLSPLTASSVAHKQIVFICKYILNLDTSLLYYHFHHLSPNPCLAKEESNATTSYWSPHLDLSFFFFFLYTATESISLTCQTAWVLTDYGLSRFPLHMGQNSVFSM